MDDDELVTLEEAYELTARLLAERNRLLLVALEDIWAVAVDLRNRLGATERDPSTIPIERARAVIESIRGPLFAGR